MSSSIPSRSDPEMGITPTSKRSQLQGPDPAKSNSHASILRPATFRDKIRRVTSAKSMTPQALIRRRRDILSRSNHRIELDEEEIFKCTTHHKEYPLGAMKLKGLPKFDDSTAHGITEAKEVELIKEEIKKLVTQAKTKTAIMFDTKCVLGSTDLKGFEALSNVGDQIQSNIAIIKHDNSRHIVENCPSWVEDGLQDFKRSRRQLISRYRQKKSHVEGRQPKLLSDPQTNQIVYFALVDYLLAVLAWWLVRTAESKFWKTELLAILAQWAVKLKVVSHEPAVCAERSLSDGEELMRQMVADFDSREAMILRIRIGPDSAEQKSFDALDAEADLTSTYFQEKMALRQQIEFLLRVAVDGLLARERTGNNADSFEICTLVYKTGLQGTLTVLSGDKDGDIAASSDLAHMSHIYTAFELLLHNTAVATPTTRQVDTGNAVCVKWRQFKSEEQADMNIHEFHMSSIDHVVSILVPLALTSPLAAARIEQLIQIASVVADEEDPILQFMPPWKDFGAEYTFSTSEWLNRQHRSQQYHDPDVRSLPKSPLRRGIKAGTELARMMSGDITGGPPTATENRAVKVIEEYQDDSKVMDSWEFAQSSITVYCRQYTWKCLLFAMFLVCGSLAVPFSVGQRISGVDPFQIATFGWLLAGLFLVGAKSIYVSEWPWHDFLRGQVVCRGVRNLRDVTGVKAQIILMFLLHNERKMTLVTQGPHNGMFQNASKEGEGFAIDEPVKNSTMLASGFIVLKVLNEKGEHLVCMDVRKGVEWDSAVKNQSAEYLACLEIGKEGLSFEDTESDHKSPEATQEVEEADTDASHDGRDKVLKLKRRYLRWNKMVGLYVKDSRFG